MLPGEKWWGAASGKGTEMPYTEATSLALDLYSSGYGNQTASLLLSDKGRVIWCDDQTVLSITNGTISLATHGSCPIEVSETGGTLRDAYLFASRRHFPPSGRTPDLMFFERPQYNMWVELTYDENERDILAYAEAMIAHGLPPGILMIDDTWQADYGTWSFNREKFPDPKGMCDKLHAMGFKVMLWVCPWVSMDSPAYREITTGRKGLVDKWHKWSDLQKLVPDMLAAGLLGHSFVCPDMAGGGIWLSFLPGAPIDPELFVRSVQVHALCGMMQFSASPWRFLKESMHQKMVCDAVALRQKFAPRFVELAKECGRTGEPMLRPVARHCCADEVNSV